MAPNANQNPISTQLRKLFLSGMAETLEVRLQQAKESQWPYDEFLSRLLEDEVERRAQKQLAGRLKRAGLESAKTLEAFQFSFNPEIPRRQVLELATCSFIQKKRNVVLCGPTGVGKTHLAQAIGHQACRMGLEVWLVAAEQLLRQLHGGRADGSFERRLRTTLKPDLLILDEFGLKSMRSPAPEDLYEVIRGRYEKGSILVTTNKAPSEWAGLFLEPLLASAALDRLLDQAEVLVIQGPSYRSRNRQRYDTVRFDEEEGRLSPQS